MTYSRILFCSLVVLLVISTRGLAEGAPQKAAPLVIGETFTIDSKILGETRRINVYLPPCYVDSRSLRLPVLGSAIGSKGVSGEFKCQSRRSAEQRLAQQFAE